MVLHILKNILDRLLWFALSRYRMIQKWLKLSEPRPIKIIQMMQTVAGDKHSLSKNNNFWNDLPNPLRACHLNEIEVVHFYSR